MSGALSTAKPACSTRGLCRSLISASLVEHRAAELEAVVDRGGLGQIEQDLLEKRIGDVDVHAADQVGIVLALGEPARRGRGRAAFGQREHRRAARVRLDERVRVDRHEQVRFRRACLDDAVLQGNEVVAVAGEDAAHARFVVDGCLQLARDGQRDVLFPGAEAAFRARVLAAVAGIDRDDQLAAPFASGAGAAGLCAGRLGCLRSRLVRRRRRRCRGLRGILAGERSDRRPRRILGGRLRRAGRRQRPSRAPRCAAAPSPDPVPPADRSRAPGGGRIPRRASAGRPAVPPRPSDRTRAARCPA